MPGLFGSVVLDPSTRSNETDLEAVHSQMCRRLGYLSQDIQTYPCNPNGLWVGNVGPEDFSMKSWVGRAAMGNAGTVAYVGGTLHQQEDVERDIAADLARRFLESDLSVLKQLRGYYVTVLHCESPTMTVIATDRRASIPIYYAQVGGSLFFAPEVKALLDVPNLSRGLDLEAMASFLGSGHLLAEQSLVKSIRRLRGGQALIARDGRLELYSYWDFKPGSRIGNDSDQNLEEELGNLVYGAVKRNLGDPKRTVIFLSGGSDSRSILGGALEAEGGDGSRISTVCWGARRGSDSSDTAITERIAREYGLNHRAAKRGLENFESDFTSVNYIIDGQSDMAALHPQEHALMLNLRKEGFKRALRGDQVLVTGGGRRLHVHTHSQAFADVGLRRLRNVSLVADYLNPSFRRTLMEASDAAMESALQEVRHLDPNDAKHYLYFVHRVQSYLNSANYFKQVVLDSRNVLLDEELLTFLERVPVRLRTRKQLLNQAMQRRYPSLWAVPRATEHNLEDRDRQLGSDTAVRMYVESQLQDRESAIWQYFDRQALKRLLDSMVSSTPNPRSQPTSGIKNRLRARLLSIAPRATTALLAAKEARHHPANRALFRVVALKNWLDSQLRVDR